MRHKKWIPILACGAAALSGLILFLNFKTPHTVLTNWIVYFGTDSVWAPQDEETYFYALDRIAGTNLGYYGGIVLMIAGLLGAALSAVLMFVIKDGGRGGSGYCDMRRHILLLLFTCGVYYLIWIYRAAGYLDQAEGKPTGNQTGPLLLCTFVPFYTIYWVYQSARRLDRAAEVRGVASDLTTIFLILAIFAGIIPPIIMQDKINEIAEAEGTI